MGGSGNGNLGDGVGGSLYGKGGKGDENEDSTSRGLPNGDDGDGDKADGSARGSSCHSGMGGLANDNGSNGVGVVINGFLKTFKILEPKYVAQTEN